MRITGNYELILRLIIDEHLIPRAEHIFNQLKGVKLFCHLDITDAYSHLVLDEQSSHALKLNTPTHDPFNPSSLAWKAVLYETTSIPNIWQRKIEAVLQDLSNVKNFYDDLLLFAEDFDSLLRVLKTLKRLRKHGLRLNRKKCVFATSAVEFLGYKIDSQGIHKSDKHVQAVRNTPRPSTPEELQLFLGKTTF